MAPACGADEARMAPPAAPPPPPPPTTATGAAAGAATGPAPPPARRSPWRWLRWALAILPLQFGLFWLAVGSANRPFAGTLLFAFAALALVQTALFLIASGAGVRAHRHHGRGLGAAAAGLLGACGALVTGCYGLLFGLFAAGGGWGRPLRVRGRQRHPALRPGADWARGARPDAEDLDLPTRRALEALWLHDAQKEHASVPAFARVGWWLSGCGAPAELLAWCHRAALEEIEHAELCFALAAGYGGREHTVEPMPELLAGGLRVRGPALVALARESLADGCLLEDFNADVAAACAQVCAEPATRAVLEQVAREEREHARFSWAVVRWALGADAAVAPALGRAIAALPRYRRPTAVGWRLRRLVARADPGQLRRHGRLGDGRWAELWRARLQATVAAARALLEAPRGGEARAAQRPCGTRWQATTISSMTTSSTSS